MEIDINENLTVMYDKSHKMFILDFSEDHVAVVMTLDEYAKFTEWAEELLRNE